MRKKVIVLGVDAMDPAFVERHWNALPNLARLRDRGSFTRLATTTPPQSPVAWSSFITGLEPGQHGIFDFVHRDPATHQPFSSMSETEGPRFTLPLGPWVLPLSGSRVISLRKGTAFWQTLAEHGVNVNIVRMPTNYPPLNYGHEIAGMGTPDLRGTLGTFAYYTDDPDEITRSVAGGRIVKIALENGHAMLPVEGPPNSLRRDRAFASVNLIVDVDPRRALARLTLGNSAAIIREGEWSDWISADFALIPHLASVCGMFRVFAKQLHPRLELYVSPVNIDPVSPALPISSPPSWGQTIARESGRFYTMGTAEDTAALRQGVFTLPEFLSQTRLVFEDERRLLRYSLAHFNNGLLFFYFSVIDQNSHMLWGRHEAELLDVYRAVDECIGEVMRAQPDADLMVMSDHGFTTFDRAVNLNTWLLHHGYLSITSSGAIDWSATKAWALGLNGLYLNLADRARLRDELLAFRDPINGRQVIETLVDPHASPANARIAPSLIVGYARGYRASWQTALGEVPAADEVEDNTDAWIGDHCINAADVPGVLFTSRKIRAVQPRIEDVTATILHLFAMPPAASASGHSVY